MRKVIWIAMLVALAGCGGGSGPTGVGREDASKALRDGLTAFDGHDYQKAADQLSTAIDAGWLNPDLATEAVVKRAVCRANLRDFAGAEADLDRVKNAPDQGSVLAAKAYVLARQGRTAEAKQVFAQAKRIDPLVKPFD